jgi:hypothetical protein
MPLRYGTLSVEPAIIATIISRSKLLEIEFKLGETLTNDKGRLEPRNVSNSRVGESV